MAPCSDRPHWRCLSQWGFRSKAHHAPRGSRRAVLGAAILPLAASFSLALRMRRMPHRGRSPQKPPTRFREDPLFDSLLPRGYHATEPERVSPGLAFGLLVVGRWTLGPSGTY